MEDKEPLTLITGSQPDDNVFSRLYREYEPSVLAIEIETNDGNLDIGTGYHIGDGVVVTARHVVEQAKSIRLVPHLDSHGVLAALQEQYRGLRGVDEIKIFEVIYPKEDSVDLAVLKTSFSIFKNEDFHQVVYADGTPHERVPHLKLAYYYDDFIFDHVFVMNEVLMFGYPRIPQSKQAVLVTVRAQISAIIDKYTAPYAHFVVSSMARGGFSGGPIVHESGEVIATCTEALIRDYQNIETGFAAAISNEPLLMMLAENKIFPGSNAEIIADIRETLFKSEERERE